MNVDDLWNMNIKGEGMVVMDIIGGTVYPHPVLAQNGEAQLQLAMIGTTRFMECKHLNSTVRELQRNTIQTVQKQNTTI
jgi:hypothetical protein